MALPLPYVEVNPEDAKRLGLQSGDLVEVYNEEGNGTFLVYVTDAVKPGMLFLVMYHWRGTSNSLVSGYTDPKTTIPWYKHPGQPQEGGGGHPLGAADGKPPAAKQV